MLLITSEILFSQKIQAKYLYALQMTAKITQ